MICLKCKQEHEHKLKCLKEDMLADCAEECNKLKQDYDKEINQLQGKVISREVSYAELKQKHEKTTNELRGWKELQGRTEKSLAENIKENEKIVKELNERIISLDEQSLIYFHNLMEAKKELQEAQEKINQLVDNCNTLEANKDAYKEELQEKQEELKHFISECNEKNKLINELMQDNAKRGRELFEASKELQESEDICLKEDDGLVQEIIKLKQDNEKVVKELKDKQNKINQLVDNCNVLEANKDAYKEELQDLQDKEVKLNQHCSKVEHEFESYKAKVINVVEERKENVLQRLKDLGFPISTQKTFENDYDLLLNNLNEQSETTTKLTEVSNKLVDKLKDTL